MDGVLYVAYKNAIKVACHFKITHYDEFTSNTLKWFKTAIKLFTYFIKWNLEDL